MHPMLTQALVAPRQDDLRKSARAAMAPTRFCRSTEPARPLPAWTRTLTGFESRLASEPASRRCGDVA